MWPFNRPTNGDLSKRIDILEDELSQWRHRTAELSGDLNDVEQELEQVEDELSAVIDAVNRVAVDDIPDRKVPQKVDTVYTLPNDCVGYKTTENEVATLVFPEGTLVVYAWSCDWDSRYGVKLRADQAIVARLEHPHHAKARAHSVKSYEGTQHRTVQDRSVWDEDFTYTVGEVVTPDNRFDPSTDSHCSGGIHFYRNLEDVV
jgi:hypothetical protein